MRTLVIAAALALVAGAAIAGGIDIKINKDAIVVSPIDPQGLIIVQGMPGAVMGGMPPVRVVAQSKKTKLSNAGMVGPDGGFMVQVPSMLKDSIKLVFIGADGKKKDHTVKAPKAGLFPPPPPPQAGAQTTTETVTVPAGEQAPSGAGPQWAAPAGRPPAQPEPRMVPAGQAPPPPPQTDSQIMQGEKDLNASGVVE